jgi:beta-glucosidase
MTRIGFPKGFLWGVATAAYQIEGSPLEDGASPSVWHEFSHSPRRIIDGTNGDIACDHYHRWREDIGLMKELGLSAYRFSVAWPRIFPEPGKLNQRGIDFYSRLVDGLLGAGIEPWVTVFHWDQPVWLEKMGGFLERSSVDHFVEYGRALFRALGDRVKRWITVNEPSVFSSVGYILGYFPPGRKMDFKGMYHSSHYLLLAHARLCEAFNGSVPNGKIGIALNKTWCCPRNPESRKDREAAGFMDEALNRFFADPLFFGRYPQKVLTIAERSLPKGFEKDLPSMKGGFDFAGINYYSRSVYRHSIFQPVTHAKLYEDPKAPRSAMWEIDSGGLYRFLLRFRDEYGNIPCYVTENGFPLPEKPGRDPLDDPERISYLADHVAAVGKAVAEGVDCRGYFVWSLMDNFEWAYGHTMPFGLAHIDFKTLERRWKRSAFWYQDLIRRNWLEV